MKINKTTEILKSKAVVTKLIDMNEFIIRHGNKYYKYIIPDIRLEFFNDAYNIDYKFITYNSCDSIKRNLMKNFYEDSNFSDTYYKYKDMVRIEYCAKYYDGDCWIGGVRELLDVDDLCLALME
jgi:hypothetical protein